jgi:hypothetical protein
MYQTLSRRAVAFVLAIPVGVVVFQMLAPTPDAVREFLEKNGYLKAEVHGPIGHCGKNNRKFTFRAISSNSRATSGEVCAGTFIYTIMED